MRTEKVNAEKTVVGIAKKSCFTRSISSSGFSKSITFQGSVTAADVQSVGNLGEENQSWMIMPNGTLADPELNMPGGSGRNEDGDNSYLERIIRFLGNGGEPEDKSASNSEPNPLPLAAAPNNGSPSQELLGIGDSQEVPNSAVDVLAPGGHNHWLSGSSESTCTQPGDTAGSQELAGDSGYSGDHGGISGSQFVQVLQPHVQPTGYQPHGSLLLPQQASVAQQEYGAHEPQPLQGAEQPDQLTQQQRLFQSQLEQEHLLQRMILQQQQQQQQQMLVAQQMLARQQQPNALLSLPNNVGVMSRLPSTQSPNSMIFQLLQHQNMQSQAYFLQQQHLALMRQTSASISRPSVFLPQVSAELAGMERTGRGVTNRPVVRGRATASKSSADRPKRPLSAYNFFFKEERARILGDEEADGSSGDGNTPAEVKRQRRLNPHKKIGFEDLGKEISRRWRNLPQTNPERLRRYQQMAEQSREEYKRRMEVFKARTLHDINRNSPSQDEKHDDDSP